MFIIFLILVIIAIVVCVAVFREDIFAGFAALFVAVCLLIIPFFMTFRWQVSSAVYTGYVYSRNSSFGYTAYHIRYSQNAGEDTQPHFTVKAGTDTEKKLDKLVGSDTKVRISVPAASPKFVNNIFEPSSYAKLESVQ